MRGAGAAGLLVRYGDAFGGLFVRSIGSGLGDLASEADTFAGDGGRNASEDWSASAELLASASGESGERKIDTTESLGSIKKNRCKPLGGIGIKKLELTFQYTSVQKATTRYISVVYLRSVLQSWCSKKIETGTKSFQNYIPQRTEMNQGTPQLSGTNF